MMQLYYANERGAGMVAIIGVAGQEAHTVENNAYRPEEDLPLLIGEITAEFKITDIRRFDAIEALTSYYNYPSA